MYFMSSITLIILSSVKNLKKVEKTSKKPFGSLIFFFFFWINFVLNRFYAAHNLTERFALNLDDFDKLRISSFFLKAFRSSEWSLGNEFYITIIGQTDSNKLRIQRHLDTDSGECKMQLKVTKDDP